MDPTASSADAATEGVVLDHAATEQAIRDTVVARRTVRDVVVASGPEAAAYLHGQLSQDITGLAIGASTRSLLLSPQGRIDAWMRVTRVGSETFWLDLDPGFGDDALARLARFKLRTKATFERQEWSMIEVRGPGTPQRTITGPDLDEPGAAAPDSVDAELCWTGVTGFDRIGASVQLPAGVPLGDPAAFEVARLQSGLPRMGAELGEKTIPAEVPGLVEASVDFTKGCYVGQELVARVDSRGNNTPRRLWALRSDRPAATPAVGAVVSDDGTEIGVVTSAAPTADGGYVALASLGRVFTAARPVLVDGSPADVQALGGALG